MTTGREKSDGRVVPEGRRKAAPTYGGGHGGGKAATVSHRATQLELFAETADNPQGADVGVGAGRPASGPIAVLLSADTTGEVVPAMVMEEVAREGNLRKALKNVVANKGAPGPDGKSVEWVRDHFESILPRLRGELLDGSFQPGLIRRVWIPKPQGGQRGLGIPDVIDRVVQQAVLQVLAPHYEPNFHPSSHGFIHGRSCHTAIHEAAGYVGDGRDIVVDIDLERFFDRVNQQRLMARLEQKVSDRRLLTLIRRMLKAGIVMPDGVVVTNDEGVPQGGPLSPLLSNIVLDELDWELERRGLRFVRYADDCNIYVRSKRAGYRVMASITRFIERRLRLKVNESKSAVAPPEDRHFVGFRLHRDPMDGSVQVLLSKRTLERIDTRIREMTPRSWGHSMRTCIQRLNVYLKGWIGFFWIVTDTEQHTLHRLESHLRRRLRAIQLRHWKSKKTIYRRLIQMGCRSRTVYRSVYGERRSTWALSHCSLVERALRNQFFTELGLISLTERRQDLWDHHTIARVQHVL
jgi:group II intron reverse transcriptase/maturase